MASQTDNNQTEHMIQPTRTTRLVWVSCLLTVVLIFCLLYLNGCLSTDRYKARRLVDSYLSDLRSGDISKYPDVDIEDFKIGQILSDPVPENIPEEFIAEYKEKLLNYWSIEETDSSDSETGKNSEADQKEAAEDSEAQSADSAKKESESDGSEKTETNASADGTMTIRVSINTINPDTFSVSSVGNELDEFIAGKASEYRENLETQSDYSEETIRSQLTDSAWEYLKSQLADAEEMNVETIFVINPRTRKIISVSDIH